MEVGGQIVQKNYEGSGLGLYFFPIFKKRLRMAMKKSEEKRGGMPQNRREDRKRLKCHQRKHMFSIAKNHQFRKQKKEEPCNIPKYVNTETGKVARGSQSKKVSPHTQTNTSAVIFLRCLGERER